MQPNETALDVAPAVETVIPAVETVLAAIQADAVVDTVQYLAEAVTQMDGE
jgi:hypothetical protein